MKNRTADRRGTDAARRALALEVGRVAARQAERFKGMYGLLQQQGVTPGDVSQNPAVLSSTPFTSGPKAFAVWQDFKRQLEGRSATARPTDRDILKERVRAMHRRRLDQLAGD